MKAGWALGARAAHAYFIEEPERDPAQGRRGSGSAKHRGGGRVWEAPHVEAPPVEAPPGETDEDAEEGSGEGEGPERLWSGINASGSSRPGADDKHASSSSGSSTPTTSLPGAEETRSRGRGGSRARVIARRRSKSREAGAGLAAGSDSRSRSRSFKGSSGSGPVSAGRNGRRPKVALKRWKREKPLPGSSSASQVEGRGQAEAEARIQAEAEGLGREGAQARQAQADEDPGRRVPFSAPAERPVQKAEAGAARPLASPPSTREWLRSPSLVKTASLLSAMHLSTPSPDQGSAPAQVGAQSAGRDAAAGGAGGPREERGASGARLQHSVSSTYDSRLLDPGGVLHGMAGQREGAMQAGVVSAEPSASDRSFPPVSVPARPGQWPSVGPPAAPLSGGSSAPTVDPSAAPQAAGSSATSTGRVVGSTHSEAGPNAILPLPWHFPLFPKARSAAAPEVLQSAVRTDEAARVTRRVAPEGRRSASSSPAPTGLSMGSASLRPGLGSSSELGGAHAARGSSKHTHKGADEEAPRAKAFGGRSATATVPQERGHHKPGQDGTPLRQREEQGKQGKTGTRTHRNSTSSKSVNTKGTRKSSSSSNSRSGMRQPHDWGGAGASEKPLPTALHAGQMASAPGLHRASSDGAVLQGVLEEVEEEGQGRKVPEEQGAGAWPAPTSANTQARDTVHGHLTEPLGEGSTSGSPRGTEATPREDCLRPDLLHAGGSTGSSNTSGNSSGSASRSSSDSFLERFELDDLRLATSNFHSRYLLGAGSFGRVYAGCLQGWARAGTSAGLPQTTSSAFQHSGTASPLSAGRGSLAQSPVLASHHSGAVSPVLSSSRHAPTTHSLPTSPLRTLPLGPRASAPPHSDTPADARGPAAGAGTGVKADAHGDAPEGPRDGAAKGEGGGVGFGSSTDTDRGRLVAIKVLSSRRQGMDEWLNELSMARFTADHPNVVRLRGYCFDEGFSMLVYDLCTKGNLAEYIMPADSARDGHQHDDGAGLEEGISAREKQSGDTAEVGAAHDEEGSAERQRNPLLAHLGATHAPLTWAQRLHVMRGVVAGLAHLHSHNIIHRDLKLANVLLDQDLNAKLSDYGLAKQVGSGKDGYLVTQKVMGTVGYLDPAYYRTGQLRRDSDVYSLGVVLLQLLTGRPAHDFEEGRPLVMLLRPYITLALSLRDQEVQAGDSAHGPGSPPQGSQGEEACVAPAPLASKMAAIKRQLDRIMDSTLLGQYSVLSALRVLQIAARCVAMEGQARPDIKSIHDQLALLS